MIPNKLLVCKQAIYSINSKQFKVRLHEFDSFWCWGIAKFWHHLKQNGKGNAMRSNSKNQDIDVCSSNRYSDMNRCMLGRKDSIFTSVSKLVASFLKQTVWTWQRVQINKPKNFIRAIFILLPKTSDNVVNKTLFLISILVFMYLRVTCSSISPKKQNVRLLSHVIFVSYYQVISI